jgi:hypothetical protein
MEFRTHCRVWALAVYLLATALARAVAADPVAPPVEFHIEGGDATTTLTEFSRQARLQLLFDYNVVKGHKTKPLDGTLTPAEALRRLLAEHRPRIRLRQRAHVGGHAAESATATAPSPPASLNRRSARHDSRKRTSRRRTPPVAPKRSSVSPAPISATRSRSGRRSSARTVKISMRREPQHRPISSHPAADIRRRPQPGHLHRPGGADELRPRRRREPPRARRARDARSHRRAARGAERHGR